MVLVPRLSVIVVTQSAAGAKRSMRLLRKGKPGASDSQQGYPGRCRAAFFFPACFLPG